MTAELDHKQVVITALQTELVRLRAAKEKKSSLCTSQWEKKISSSRAVFDSEVGKQSELLATLERDCAQMREKVGGLNKRLADMAVEQEEVGIHDVWWRCY